MPSQGPLFPATETQFQNVGTGENQSWAVTGSAGSDNGVEDTVTASAFDAGITSRQLRMSNFGFTIPTSATIDGITVEIERRTIVGGTGAVDFRVQLSTADDTFVGSNKASGTNWPASATIATYGGAADTWAASPTPTMVNASGFGVTLSATAQVNDTDIGVDFIRMTITYTDPLAPGPALSQTIVVGL